jgi:predicted O-methyltransferase YrrM
MARVRLAYDAALHGSGAADLLVPYRSVLDELSRSGATPCKDAHEALIRITQVWPETQGKAHLRHDTDNEVVWADALRQRKFPDHFASGAETLRLLRGLVSLSRPRVAIETGVADGASTRTILHEMNINGGGVLISYDIDPAASDSGRGVPGPAKWRFEILEQASALDALKERVQDLEGPIDLWYHDSDHSYHWQTEELRLAASVISRPGIIVVDDVDGNGAFAKFLREVDCEAWTIFDGSTCSGVALMT